MKNIMNLKTLVPVALCLLASQGNAAGYTFTDLGTLGGANSVAFAINNLNQIVGSSGTSGGTTHATLWSGGAATDLGTLDGGSTSKAIAINNLGQIVGDSDSALGGQQATLWSNKVATGLGDLGGGSSSANGINDAGLIVGSSRVASTSMPPIHAVLWNGAVATDLDPAGSQGMSVARGINSAGLSVGTADSNGFNTGQATTWNGVASSTLPPGSAVYGFGFAVNDAGVVVGLIGSNMQGNQYSHAAIWNGAKATDLGTLGVGNSAALGINASGVVVGEALSADGLATHAVMWNGSTAIDLNSFLDKSVLDAGWALENAYGINNAGWIVGNAYNAALGVSHAFVLAPTSVPEVNSSYMWAIGLVFYLLGIRRRVAR